MEVLEVEVPGVEETAAEEWVVEEQEAVEKVVEE